MAKRKRRRNPRLLIVLLIILVGILGAGTYVINKNTPSKERQDLVAFYDPDGTLGENRAVIILGERILEERGLLAGENAYLPLDVVNTYINQRFYYDEENRQMLYATPEQLDTTAISDIPGADAYLAEDGLYLKISYISRFTDMDVYQKQEPARIIIQTEFTDLESVSVNASAPVRISNHIKAPILCDVSQGTHLRFVEEDETAEWDKVATEDGYIGYIQKKFTSQPEVLSVSRSFSAPSYQYITENRPVIMVWDNMESEIGNSYFEANTENTEGVTVLSPTWFFVRDDYGNIEDISSAEYVEKAHSRGMKVWGLVNDIKYMQTIRTEAVLGSTSARRNLIGQLMEAAGRVGLDGINVDLEYVLNVECGRDFLQFLRELSIECHRAGLTLSVDNPVPKSYNHVYDRKEQAEIVDYVIMMGYDEHTSSTELGSVASLPWVESGIIESLKSVPPERLINALPFYTRVWKTWNGSLAEVVEITMLRSLEILEENEVESYWDLNLCQYVVTYEKDGFQNKMWLEESRSIGEKARLVSKYGLAGVAGWALGAEDSSVWAAIRDNI